MKLQRQLEIAEQRARQRESERRVDLSEVAKQEQKANQMGYGLYKIKKKNKTPFVQMFHENIDILIKEKYMTMNELGFLSALSPFIAMGSNAVKHPETDHFMTITEIANVLGFKRETLSRTIKKMLDKGLMYEIVSAREIKLYKRNVNARPLFVNPEIMYKGNKDEIDPMLCDMVMEYDYIEKNKILLEWKVWHTHDQKAGKILSRSTYLKYRKQSKKK
ncbi:hypothetical protein MXL46_09325 [Heyndrickxia sporothermodurans]|uniref:hypothetical protein n=1 Tax=Heyndrickxia sporothermodurans TaxID=46224 RepID=UPI002DB79E2B|nr:hypothetical protein [Heyndrickxia sporothermodurans]MEB6549294.1 hypothetical protein [Heyndrickxia sporothermodurans]